MSKIRHKNETFDFLLTKSYECRSQLTINTNAVHERGERVKSCKVFKIKKKTARTANSVHYVHLLESETCIYRILKLRYNEIIQI